jgi:hypothetical protein
VLTALAVGLLVLVHLGVGRSSFFEKDPSGWKSVAGGVGISYAFLVLLPKIAAAQQALEVTTARGLYGYLEHHAYLVALAGLVLHFGLDVAVERVLVMPARRPWKPAVTLLVVGHASGLFGYFFLIGYLVAKTPRDQTASLVLFTIAMAIHSLAMDHGLLEKYAGLFDRVLRWVFAVATALGALLAVATEIPYGALALLNSLFAGMLMIATVKEKIPGGADARVGPFLAGVVGYSLLLLLTDQLTL